MPSTTPAASRPAGEQRAPDAGPWLMVSLGAGPMGVALTQTASALPFFLFALPAGAIGDIVDRRKLILYTEFWMVGAALVLAVATMAGVMSPSLLLGLTFAISAGDAVEAPTWRALAGVIIAVAGVGAAFMVNVVSFLGVILLVARWKRPVRRRTTPPETLAGATVAALRYVRYSPSLRGLTFRAGLTMFFASALLALLPSLAKSVSGSPTGYGILLGCFGAGAVIGAVVMQPVRARWPAEVVASGAIAILGAMTIATSVSHTIVSLAVTMVVAGAGWIVFISLVSALMQLLAPDWVRARVLAVFMLVFQGGLAAGSQRRSRDRGTVAHERIGGTHGAAPRLSQVQGVTGSKHLRVNRRGRSDPGEPFDPARFSAAPPVTIEPPDTSANLS